MSVTTACPADLPANDAFRCQPGSLIGPSVAADSAAIFRMVLGAAVCFWSAHYLLSGRAHALCSGSVMHLLWPGFGWVPAPGTAGTTLLFGILFVAGFLLLVGAAAQAASAVIFAGLAWFFLTDQTSYQNHYYLLLLLTAVSSMLPLSRTMSVDADSSRQTALIPLWVLLVLRFHVALPYIFGGISKLDGEWLSGRPMLLLLCDRFGLQPATPVSEAVSLVLTWGGLIFDLTIVPLLHWRLSRQVAFLALMLFHITNACLFPIHIFPWFMIGASTVFLAPDWPASILAKLTARRHTQFEPGDAVATAELPKPPRPNDLLLLTLGCWCLLQLLLPLRHLAIPGDASWTEQGHFFAWRMMLRGKTGEVHFLATRPTDGFTWLADHSRLLHHEQQARFSIDPEMIRKVAATIARLHRERTGEQIEVRALALASLNGRPPALLIDPDVDLAAEPEFAVQRSWILPKPPASEQLWRYPPGDWITRVPLPDRWQTAFHRTGHSHRPAVTTVKQTSD